MKNGYFHRVHRHSPTKFWINNPTPTEARTAIEAGAVGCTNNPSYSFKMLEHPETAEQGKKWLERRCASRNPTTKRLRSFSGRW